MKKYIGGLLAAFLLWGGIAQADSGWNPQSGDLNISGTNESTMTINADAAAGSAEDVTLRLLGGDGSALQAWQFILDASEKDLLLQYAEDPGSYSTRVTFSDDSGMTILGSTSANLTLSNGTQTFSVYHDGTDAVIDTSAGNLKMEPSVALQQQLITPATDNQGIIFGAGAGALYGNYSYDQLGLFLGASIGTQLIIGEHDYRSKDYDRADQTNPTLFGFSALNPDTSNNQWWGITHDQTGMLITTGANTGSGTGATTIDNYIAFAPRGSESVRFDGSGNVGIGTTDLDGTPDIGKLTVKGSTNDGTTNVFVGRDSDEANVFIVDTDGGVTSSSLDTTVIKSGLPAGETSNCGVTYSGSTLTITQEDGTALSTSEPCCVGVPGATAGQSSTMCYTSAISSTFGSSSDTDGNTFGTTASTAWGENMPMFLHVCRGSASNYFGFSRNPARSETGAAASDMCQEGDTDCDAQGDLFIMATGLTLADEVDMPCITVGAVRVTKNASDEWVVTALGNTDGIGQDRLVKTFATRWAFPAGQNGALTQGGTATYLYVAGGDGTTDVPTWAGGQGDYYYTLGADGFVDGVFSTVNYGACTNGDVAAQLRIVFPYIPSQWAISNIKFLAGTVRIGANYNVVILEGTLTGTLASITQYDETAINANSFSDTADDFRGISFRMKAF